MSAWLFAVVLVAAQDQAGIQWRGIVPPTLTAPSRAIWIADDASQDGRCALVSPRQWACVGLGDAPRGVLIIVGADGVVRVNVGPSMAGSGAVRRWGRVVVVTDGGINPDDLAQVSLEPWKPNRSRVRPRAMRFGRVREPAMDIVRVSNRMFWVAGNDVDTDTFLELDGPTVGSARLPASELMNGAPDLPLYLSAVAPASLTGRVQSSDGRDVDDVAVEIFEPLSLVPDQRSEQLESLPLIQRAETRTDRNGAFTVDRLVSVPLLAIVNDPVRGRGAALVHVFGESIVVRLVQPVRATGRVLRHHIPVDGARVRFVPDADAYSSSGDPNDLLTGEQTTGGDGAFELPLPSIRSGAIQITAPDGTTARVVPSMLPMSKTVALGDIELPDHRRIALRLVDASGCLLAAVGPLGRLGMTTVQALPIGDLRIVDFPEPGEWALTIVCDRIRHAIDPPIIDVTPGGPERTVDVRVVR